mgnify:CR=1 FL=1
MVQVPISVNPTWFYIKNKETTHLHQDGKLLRNFDGMKQMATEKTYKHHENSMESGPS